MSTLLKSELNLGIENDEVEYTLSDLGIKHENEEGKERPMEERALAEDKGHVFTAVLSREESDGIIAFLEREGAAHWRTQGHGDSASEERRYRNYSRQCFFSTELGDLLEKRMGGQLLPESMMAARVVRPEGREAVKPQRGDDGVMETEGVVGTEGEWAFHRVNPYFRALKYGAGGYFAPHTDGVTSLSTAEGGAYGERSFVTLMVYLNGGFEGGATQFYKDNSVPLYTRPESGEALVDRVSPAPGQLLAFWHHAVHEGEEVVWPEQGEGEGEGEGRGGAHKQMLHNRRLHKIALRTEAMFVRRSVPADPLDPDGAGLALLREARDLSDASRYPEAIRLFSRLRHQYPHLAEAEGVM